MNPKHWTIRFWIFVVLTIFNLVLFNIHLAAGLRALAGYNLLVMTFCVLGAWSNWYIPRKLKGDDRG